RNVAPFPVPLSGEAVPGEADLRQAGGDLVEAVDDHHHDGEHQIGDDQPRVRRQQEPRPPPPAMPGRAARRGLALGGDDRAHRYSSIVREPSTRAYAKIPISAIASRIADKADPPA